MKQRERFSNVNSINALSNADMRVREARPFCKMDEVEGESDTGRDGTDGIVRTRASPGIEACADDC